MDTRGDRLHGGFAYVIAMIVYQVGGLITGETPFTIFTVIAMVLLGRLWSIC